MTPPTTPSYGVKFPSRKERTVKRVTKSETREIQKRMFFFFLSQSQRLIFIFQGLEPPKPVRVRPPPKPKAPKKTKPPATLSKPVRPPSNVTSRSNVRPTTSNPPKQKLLSTSRTLQAPDLEKLARLSCSREFSLFHQYIKSDLSKSNENQLAFLQTKLQLLKNEFTNRQAEHLNFEQIKEYYNQAVKEHVRRQIKADEYVTLAEKFRQDIKEAIDKWLRKKEFKPPKQVTEFLQRRQERIRGQIKQTIEDQKKQQQLTKQTEDTSSMIITPATIAAIPTEATVEDDDIMIID
ncbi:unnamed protein product [Rotaria sp. Silwood2]|nr:unnamed protein product [Rotaria sp. Silwood2]CAF2578384.1 unnamed protein product [Rotaria sp. Silwood2]CAF2825367.1 unnamed protein product [Rotaria sp. Silwood2]CAF2986403.1 unnamed protein product [Rotaria sp. Silwood2]CAF3953284.1 unnamed protein product [Rotaria sp. Silwood2]